MKEEIIILGENISPPVVNMKTSQAIYNIVRTEDFEVETFNSLLAAIVTYLDVHNVNCDDKNLPWAEAMVGGNN